MAPTTISQQAIDEAKVKYGEGNVKLVDLPKDDNNEEFLEVLMKRPGRKAIAQYQLWADKNPDKANELLINDALLSNKDEVKADDGLFLAAVDAAAQLMPIRKAIVKNC